MNEIILSTIEMFPDTIVSINNSILLTADEDLIDRDINYYLSDNTYLVDCPVHIVRSRHYKVFDIFYNNYEYLKKNGFNGHSKIVDHMPFGNTSMTFGDYFNIEPIGLNKAEKKSYYAKRKEEISSLIFHDKTLKERVKKSQQKASIKQAVLTYKEPLFISLLLNDNNLKIDYRRKIKAIFGKLDTPFCFVSDFGLTDRLHFHGFIDNVESISSSSYWTGHYSQKSHLKEYKLPVLEEKLGYCPFSFVKNLDSSIEYCIKYMLKKENKHFIIKSRKKRS